MIYIYDSVEVAKSIVMTAYYLGFECHNIGSAVVMNDLIYNKIIENTMSPEAVIIAKEVNEER